MPGPVYEFGDFKLDCGRFELLHNGRALRVERKPMELLILLASRQGQLVSRAEIAQRLWSSEVFVDTEHGINTAIRKLRQLLHDDPDSPQFIQTVTGMGYRFIAPTVCSENSAAGRQKPDPSEPAAEPANAPLNSPLESYVDLPAEAPEAAAPASQESTRKSLAVQMVLVARFVALTVLFIVMALGPRQIAALLHRNANPPITSLAVIPLDNLTGDPNQEYFADGMTDELITMLARDSTLRITSRTSVMQYKGAHKPLPEIARALNVDAIVEGSLSRSNEQVHMTLQLIRADSDAHLWANSYNRGANDSVSLPAEAAREIAIRLNSYATGKTPERYVNPAAHDAYLHGLYIWYGGSNEKAGEYFKKAVEIQPDYPLGLTGLAAYYAAGSFEGELDPRDALPKAEAAAAAAIKLDDSLPEAHSTMAAAVYAGRWDWKWSEQEVRRAVELDPRFAEGWHLYAKMLGPLNRSEEAIAAQKKATELDPFARPWAMAEILFVARRYDAAITEADLRLEVDPNNAILHKIKSDCYRAKGMKKESAREFIEMLKISGDLGTAAAQRAFEKNGSEGIVRWQIAMFKVHAREGYVSPVFLAQLHAELGEREPTLSLLEEAFRQHSPVLLWIQRYQDFDFLHDDPRYISLVHNIGLPPA